MRFIGLDLIAAVHSFVLQTLQIMKHLLSVDFVQFSFTASGCLESNLMIDYSLEASGLLSVVQMKCRAFMKPINTSISNSLSNFCYLFRPRLYYTT